MIEWTYMLRLGKIHGNILVDGEGKREEMKEMEERREEEPSCTRKAAQTT